MLGPPPVSSLLAADRLPASSTEKLDSPPRPPGLASGTGAVSVSQGTDLEEVPEFIEHLYSRIQADLQFVIKHERRRAGQGEDRSDRIEKLLTIQGQIRELSV